MRLEISRNSSVGCVIVSSRSQHSARAGARSFQFFAALTARHETGAESWQTGDMKYLLLQLAPLATPFPVLSSPLVLAHFEGSIRPEASAAQSFHTTAREEEVAGRIPDTTHSASCLFEVVHGSPQQFSTPDFPYALGRPCAQVFHNRCFLPSLTVFRGGFTFPGDTHQ